jgi:outer membrane protein assembly factor BamB
MAFRGFTSSRAHHRLGGRSDRRDVLPTSPPNDRSGSLASRGIGRWAIAASALLVAGCASGPSIAPPAPIASPEDSGTTVPVEGTPVEVTDFGSDWVLPGRDYANSRATFDSDIDATSVRSLEVAWEVEMAGTLSTVPLIIGDTVYAQDGRGTVVAVDRATGADRWRSEPFGFNIGPFGVAVADGRLFAMSGSNGVVAFDAESGAELWRKEITATPTTGVDIQPTVFDDIVLVSTVPVSVSGIYTPGDRGVINALDAATGEVRWTFDTVEGDLWGHAEVNSGGGAWYPPSIDPVARVVYWGIANPAPFPGTPEFPNGSSRAGDNLYTDSAVALDLDTGELLWHHQVHPHDILDRDLVHTMTVPITSDRHLTVTTGKGGVVVGLDPETGARQWATPVGRHQNDDLAELPGPTEVYPGTYGGIISPPAHADGTIYAAVVNAPTMLSPDAKAYIGSELGVADGEVVAIDATTGAVRWTTAVPGDPMGAATVVNDLVLTALLDGQILALDRDTGEIVWRTTAPGGINGWMAVAGDLLVVPVGSAQPPRLVAYRLAPDGNADR